MADVCSHCGVAYASRNALFRQREGCDPFAGHARGKVREQIALVVGYRGSRYHGCVFQNETDEAANPTVEGAILAAARRAWGPVVLKCTRSTRTERGIHAAENVFLLTVATSMLEEPHVEAALVKKTVKKQARQQQQKRLRIFQKKTWKSEDSLRRGEAHPKKRNDD